MSGDADLPRQQSDLDRAQHDVLELRKSLQAGVAVETRATSIDGLRFSFQTPLDVAMPLGGFVLIATIGGERFFGQVTDRFVEERAGARVAIEVPEVALGQARVSQAELGLTQRMTVGAGMLLARLGDREGDFFPTTTSDVFDGADLVPAPPESVADYLASQRRGTAELDVGWSPFGGPEVRTAVDAGGFNRHTFLCGQSGSGKTFSLGVILERLLLDTNLPMIVVDPNSDFVHLNELRPLDDVNRTVAEPLSGATHESLASRYRTATDSARVLRPNDPSSPLRIRFSELAPHEQAAVLKLDPLRDRTEFAAYREIAADLSGGEYSLRDIRDAAMRSSNEDARQVRLRLDNLGVADWAVWADGTEPSLSEELSTDRRAIVLDVGGLSQAEEKSVVAMSLLGRLWRRRESRQPVLLVIDEAHNVCPAEPEGTLQALATEHVVRIAGEGRKYGIYLLLSTQRPQKLHPNVLSQCDNLVLMRMNSTEDVDQIASTFSFVPRALLDMAPNFTLGEALIAGKIAPTPTLTKIEGRLSPEGGGDVSAEWAATREQP